MQAKPFRFTDFQAQAADIVDRARAEAGQILREAGEEAERLRGEARLQGAEEGRERALIEERARLAVEIDQAIRLVAKIVREVDARRDALVQEAERDLVRLALAIAERVVKGEIKAKRRVAEANLQAAAAMVARRQGLVARLNPEDLKRIESAWPELRNRLGDLSLKPDPSIEPGGCVMDLAPGEIDLQIKTQLERIEKELLE